MDILSLKPYLLLALAAAFSTAGNLILKFSKTANLDFLPLWLIELKPLFFVAVAFYMLNLLVFWKALEILPVNVGYPVLASLGFIMLAFSSAILLQETLTWIQICGLIVIIVGIFMLASLPTVGRM